MVQHMVHTRHAISFDDGLAHEKTVEQPIRAKIVYVSMVRVKPFLEHHNNTQ